LLAKPISPNLIFYLIKTKSAKSACLPDYLISKIAAQDSTEQNNQPALPCNFN